MYTYDNATGDCKLDSVPPSKIKESAEIAEHVLAFLENGGKINHLESFDSSRVAVFNNQRTTDAIQNRCDSLKKVIKGRGYSDVKITWQPGMKQFYASIDGAKPVTLGVNYDYAKRTAKSMKF